MGSHAPRHPICFTGVTITATSATATTNKTVTLTGVLFGDVWVCSGQSNMAYRMQGVNNVMLTRPTELATMNETRFQSMRMFFVGNGGMPALQIEVPTHSTF